MIVMVLLAFSLVAILETMSLIKKEYWRELAVFTVLHLAALVLSLLLTLGYEPPSPAKGVEIVIRAVFNLFV